jgi:8-oxo-dGTP pyrophosphatase MutT (NUDIX family)
MHSVSVAGVIRRGDGRVLCIRRRDTGAWQIPGGVLERGESVPDGLRREVQEETGALVEPLRLTGVYLNLPLGVVALVFLCEMRAESDIRERTDEAAEICWLTLDEIRDLSVPAFCIRVTDACAAAPAPFVRTHDGVNLLPDTARGIPGEAAPNAAPPGRGL